MITNIYNIITMGYSCCVPGCKSNYKKEESSVTVFKFPSIGELREKLLQNIPRKFDKITQSTRVCIKSFEDKDVHSSNIHTNPDGTTYYFICKVFLMTTDVVVRSGFLLVFCDF